MCLCYFAINDKKWFLFVFNQDQMSYLFGANSGSTLRFVSHKRKDYE